MKSNRNNNRFKKANIIMPCLAFSESKYRYLKLSTVLREYTSWWLTEEKSEFESISFFVV